MEALQNNKDLNKFSKSSRHDSILVIVLAPNHSSLITTQQYEHNSYEFIHINFPNLVDCHICVCRKLIRPNLCFV
jgi:hypothetical protein